MTQANEYTPKKVEILETWNETHDTRTYRVNYQCSHSPGQFVEVSLLGCGEAPISICSHSTEYLELCIREVGNVTHAISKLDVGDHLWVRGPYGNGYPLNDLQGMNLVLIGGGTGAAPIRGVIEYLRQNRPQYNEVDIFLGFRTPQEVLFKRDVHKWEKDLNVHLTVDHSCEGWRCSIGFVTKLLEYSDLNPQQRFVLTCGPPIMIKSAVEILQKKGFKDEQIYTSLERHMKCGIGKCGHCMVNDKYVCMDGPVFRYDIAKELED